MDFGFASLLEKFEEYYGKRATKALVGLIGIAIVAGCLGVVWSFIFPIVGWINGTVEGQSAWAFVARFFGFAAVIFLLWACGVGFSTILEARKVMLSSSDIIDSAHEATDQAERMLSAAREIVQELGKKLGGTGIAASEFDEIIKSVEQTKTSLELRSKRLKNAAKVKS